MSELISNWLIEQGISASHVKNSAIGIGLVIIFIAASISHYLAKHRILKVITALIKKSKNTLDDALIEHNVLNRVALLLPFVLILFLPDFHFLAV